uniref:Uncharacterized protein n=1 Tax=Parascaris univalens TaxID=6257 RepID=A0A915B7I8_PARUN
MLINDRCSSVIGDTKGMCFQTATLLNKRACISVIGVRNPLFNSSHLRSMRSPHEIRAEHGEQTISFMDLSENTPAYHYGLNSCKKDYSRKITAFNDTCKVFTRADELLFICCCYEEAPMTCQMRLQNGVLPRYVAMAAWEIRCLIDEGKESGNENDTLINVVRKMEKGEVVNHHYFDEEDVRNGLKKQLRRVSSLSSITYATTTVNCASKPAEMRENTK